VRSFLDLKGRQGAGAGSAYVAGSFFVSGLLTYVFQGLSARFLGEAGYGDLIMLWSMTFLLVQVLWIGVTQTLGRFVSERLSRGEDPRPVISSAKRLQLALLGAFVLVYLLASPLITDALFRGSLPLTVALLAAVAAYAPEYFRRGTFNGHRQAARLGVLHVVESSSRALLAVVLLIAGVGVFGPALAIVLAPLIAVVAVRPTRETPPEGEGGPFSAAKAFRFTGPVLLCVAFAQVLMNGGPVFLSLLGGTRAQVGVFGAALILTRVPQYVISPAIGALLPHASRVLATEGPRSLDRFVGKAAGVVGFVGVLMVAGTWLLGEWGIRLFAGPGFEPGGAGGAGAARGLLPDGRDAEPGAVRAGTRAARGARLAAGIAGLRPLHGAAVRRCALPRLFLPRPRRLRRGRGAGRVLPDGSQAARGAAGAGYGARGPGDSINHSTVRCKPSSRPTSARQPSLRSAFVVSA
jgi:O-antigen/teichoic acid export membrane protein